MLLDEALSYLDMGWSVYPVHSLAGDACSCGRSDCPSPGKHPIGQWSKYQHRLPTPTEVSNWFTAMPDCNIGMVTGRVSGTVVVDIDSRAGLETFRLAEMPDTLCARTGGGGWHFYYQCDEVVQSHTHIRDGIDIKAEGGFVVLPPSRHGSGRNYRWLEPKGMTDFVNKFPPIRTAHRSNGGSTDWITELLEGVGEGDRNASAARLAGRYASMALVPDEIWVLMWDWNQRNQPPLSDAELQSVIRRILRKHEEHNATPITTVEDIWILLEGGMNGVSGQK